MRYVILFTIAVLIAPAALAAQNIGFAVGTRSPTTVSPHTGGVGFGFGGMVPGPGYGLGYPGYGYPNTTVIVTPDPYSVPRGGFLPKSPRSAGSILTVVGPNGGVTVIGPNLTPGRRVAPGHPTATPSHAVVAPMVFPSPITGHAVPAYGQNRGVLTIQGGRGNSRTYNTASAPTVDSAARIAIGSSRQDVLRAYGSPTYSMADRIAETLIFGGTQIVIQKGVVVAIGH
jgi:hypothetical protein